MITQYHPPPAPFTDKKKDRDHKPKLPVDQYVDWFVIIALILGFFSIYRKRT